MLKDTNPFKLIFLINKLYHKTKNKECKRLTAASEDLNWLNLVALETWYMSIADNETYPEIYFLK